MENVKWLQINSDGLILGVHSDECETSDTWIETNEHDVMPGDLWINGKLKRNRPEPVNLSEDEERENSRRIIASREIKSKYPEWNQLNILRKGDPDSVTSMGSFIDDVRDWSNNVALPDDKVDVIVNRHFPKTDK